MDFDSLAGAVFIAPSMRELESLQFARRGVEDACAGKPPSSHARVYSEGFARGTMYRMAVERQIVLVYLLAFECQRCRTLYGSATMGRCGCGPIVAPLNLGIVCTYGPENEDDEPEFMSLARLRQLVAEGVNAMTEQGECLNMQLLPQ